MKEYKIIADSASDLPNEFVKKNNLIVLPLKFHFNEETYNDFPDESEMTKKDYFKRLRQGEFPKTSQVNSSEFYKAYEKVLKEDKDILVITVSGALSGTYNSAVVAKEEILKKYPNGKIEIIDSKSGSLGEGLVVNEAIKFKELKMPLEVAAEKLNEYVYHVAHALIFDTLDFLKAGGRIGSVVYHVGSRLRFKPIISADNEGKLKLRTSTFGRKKSINSAIKRVVKGYDSQYGKEIYISHGDCLEEATIMKEAIEEQTNAKVVLHMMGPVIGTHGGPGAIAVFYPAKER